MVPIFSQNLKNCNFGRGFHGNEKKYEKNEMHFQYTVFGPLDEFHGFIQICYYECPHVSGIYLESLLIGVGVFSGGGSRKNIAVLGGGGSLHEK